MGVEATMTVGNKKDSSAATIASGGATYGAGQVVRIVSILATADLHRSADIVRGIGLCIDYARDNNLFNSATSIAVVTTLDGGKVAVRTELVAANVVTGDVGLMIGGAVRTKGSSNITDDAHNQLLDWMNETDRLAA